MTGATGQELLGAALLRLPAMLRDLRALVVAESPTADLDALAVARDIVIDQVQHRLGVSPEIYSVGGRDHLLWRFGPAPATLLLGHYDTVWPVGSLATNPWSLRRGIVRGPGSFDMKAGLVQGIHALAMLADRHPESLKCVSLMVTADEEIGSPTSREIIEYVARDHAAVLVLEASGPGGALKGARKGVSLYTVAADGRAAHSGLEPEAGVNATVEIAHQILRIAAMGSAESGTTVTPTLLRAGNSQNTVPDRAEVHVDVRSWTAAEQDRVHGEINALSAAVVIPDARISVAGGPNRPPLESSASRRLADQARDVAGSLGLGDLEAIAVGGASDGNFTAGIGVPTLDGLGAVGGGAHALDEHVVVSGMVERAALLASLLAALSHPREAERE